MNAHELTNGRYRMTLSDDGTGQSFLEWIALNRYHNGEQGLFIYLRDIDNDLRWSATGQPLNNRPEAYQVRREEQRLVFECEQGEIASEMSVEVSCEFDAECRRLKLSNLSERARRIEVTSFLEVALAHPAGDLGHPAFSKLFVQTEFMSACGALVAKRRPRSEGEVWPVMFHAMCGAPLEAWETDRLVFVGRGRSALDARCAMRGTVGNVLDPVMSLRTSVSLLPGESRELKFMLGAVRDQSEVSDVVRHICGTQTDEVSRTGMSPSIEVEDSVLHETGFGRFNEAGSEYQIQLRWTGSRLKLPPMPWCNVIANERFGFITSETGAGCTWSRNSQANRLTPWSNDPISDPQGEKLVLRDEETGNVWSPLPGPCPAPADYEMVHGWGYSRCSTTAHELEHETMMFVPRHDPIKIVRVRLKNPSGRRRRLTLRSEQRLILGTLPPEEGALKVWGEAGMLLATNVKNVEFRDGTAFSFMGATGSQACRLQAGAQSFIQELECVLEVDGSADAWIVLGEALSDEELAMLRERYGSLAAVESAFEEVKAFWGELLGRFKVKTPSPEIDFMANGWLAYQTISCRMWGRTAFYQSSGAFGFRDQLQDAGNMILLWPELTRRQILLHARHQFVEGDVLHWWHEAPMERGVRTRFSDDLLWLPYVAGQYVRSSGDVALWETQEPFLKAPPLKPGEDECYLKPENSNVRASVYEHCCLAIDRSLTCGAHGLPLMGTGDWNDGMNRVGREGSGESVWLGFILYEILGDFISLADARGDARAERYAVYREQLHIALEGAGWDGAWYRRAYYDDGTPLGTKSSNECRIDGLAQSWSVLSGAAPRERAEQAMCEAARQLVAEDHGLIRLLTPPFVNTPHDPGYIKGYVAGVRENGGQYTHAACWMVRAVAALGWRNVAARWLTMLSPLSHTKTKEDMERYKVEPYVIAADVYGAEPHVGRGGWTWYSGSAGWAYRVAIESVLGLRLENGDTLVLKPCVPDDWAAYRIEYQPPGCGSRYVFEVVNPDACSERVISILLDGHSLSVAEGEARIKIQSGTRTHHALITLGHG